MVQVRPVGFDDEVALRELHVSMSEESRYRRFLSWSTSPLEGEVSRLSRPADDNHRVVVAYHAHRMIGVASYERISDPSQAEFAVLVADDWQGNGVGTMLVEQLTEQAREQGIGELVGEILQSNAPMLRIAARRSPDSSRRQGAGVTWVRLPTGARGDATPLDRGRTPNASETATDMGAPSRVLVSL